MRKPNIVKLPTSQMMVFCDFFGLEYEQGNVPAAIEALEAVPQSQWGQLKVGVNTRAAEKIDDDIVKARLVKLGRTEAPDPPGGNDED